jgi:hypothetical protein
MSIPLGPFQIFTKICGIFAGVGDTSAKLSPVSLLPAISLRRFHCYRRLIIAGGVDTGDK